MKGPYCYNANCHQNRAGDRYSAVKNRYHEEFHV